MLGTIPVLHCVATDEDDADVYLRWAHVGKDRPRTVPVSQEADGSCYHDGCFWPASGYGEVHYLARNVKKPPIDAANCRVQVVSCGRCEMGRLRL